MQAIHTNKCHNRRQVGGDLATRATMSKLPTLMIETLEVSPLNRAPGTLRFMARNSVPIIEVIGAVRKGSLWRFSGFGFWFNMISEALLQLI